MGPLTLSSVLPTVKGRSTARDSTAAAATKMDKGSIWGLGQSFPRRGKHMSNFPQRGMSIKICAMRPSTLSFPSLGKSVAVIAASAFLVGGPLPVEAVKIPPEPLEDSATRCRISSLDKFADTRAKFSLEASSGAMDEALVDIRGCDFHGSDLSQKVFSGVLLDQANLEGARLVGVEMSRAIARDAHLANVDFTDANAYSTVFDGSDLQGAQFENAILSNASFGKGLDGQWANLSDAHFEGALLSSSDVARVCQNPTLSQDVRKYELGCK